MTTFNRSTDLPPAIDRLEEILAWALYTYQKLYGADTYQEIANLPNERVIDTSIVKVAQGDTRMVFRGAIVMNPDYASATGGKLWTLVLDQGTTPIPSAYKVD